VLFDVDSYPAYGALSGRDTEELIAGAGSSGAVQEKPRRLRAVETFHT
jgi:hypothetical protein